MWFLTLLGVGLLAVSSTNGRSFQVTNSDELLSALNFVDYNDTINLQDGNYYGDFEMTRSGDPGLPITITGSKKAVISSPNFGIHLYRVNYWTLRGFTIKNSVKGIVLNGATYITMDDLDIYDVDEEGISLIWMSSSNIIQNCNIHDTGLKNPVFSAGITVGRPVNEWGAGQSDSCAINNIFNNTIGPNVPAECVDLKEGTISGIVSGNYFNSARENGETYSDSSLSVKGSYYTIEDNTSENSRLFGFEVTRIYEKGARTCNNKILNNKCLHLPPNGLCAANQAPDCDNDFDNNVIS